jgi:glycosyltransferase involved in cell wall biosynthesis
MLAIDRTAVSVFDVEASRIGGIETFARELSSQLGDRGWKSVLCLAGPPPEPVRRYLELPNVSLEVVENVSRLTRASVGTLSRILHRYRPRVLHLHFTPFLSPYPWLGWLYDVKRVFHTDHWSRPAHYIPQRSPLWKRIVARSINFPMTGLISVSDYNYRCAATAGLIAPVHIHRIYDAVDLSQDGSGREEAASFRQRYFIPKSRPLVVQVGWIRPEKGFADLLEAARLVVTQRPDAHFAMVGEGPCRADLGQQAKEMGLAEHVTWTGLVTHPLADGVYAAADVVCQASRWQEAFGFTIAEAMSSRKPVVATRVGGVPELVVDGENGFLVAPGDSAAMAERILLLLTDRSLRERMGQAGRHAVEAKFNLKTNVADLIQLYGLA